MSDSVKAVEKLVEKAAGTVKSEDAMRYAQAALNAANALCSLRAVQATA